jgi:hypothetical protein
VSSRRGSASSSRCRGTRPASIASIARPGASGSAAARRRCAIARPTGRAASIATTAARSSPTSASARSPGRRSCRRRRRSRSPSRRPPAWRRSSAAACASRVVAIDRIPGKLEVARSLGATDTVLADDRGTVEAVIDATDGGPDFAFEAVGRPDTIEAAIGSLPPGGTAVLVGLTPVGERASFDVFPFVDGSRRILGSNYGAAVAAVDFPRYASLFLAGRLPIDRLVEAEIGLDDIEAAFDAMRGGLGLRRIVVP